MALGVDVAQLAVLALVTLTGAFLQTAFGFGFAILAAPIFLAVMGSSSAIQVLVVLHVVLSAIVVPSLRKDVPMPLLGWLAGGSLAGFPLGLALFMAADARTLLLAVGAATLGFSLMLARRELKQSVPAEAAVARPGFRPVAAAAVGLVAGALTAILVMPGPPAMLYLRGLALPKVPSRAAALSFFGFCYVMSTCLHAAVAGIDARTWATAAALAPCVLAGALAGSEAARRLSEDRYRRAVLTLLVISGVFAVVSAIS